MAKMFYTLDEARAALGKSEEEIKQYAREGRLREFRDGARLMFKADQVEQLKGELGAGGADHVDLGPSDSGAPIGLVDSRGSSGTSISLSDTDTGGRSPGGGMQLKDDTALSADLGLSGSVGGMPSPSRPGGTATGLSGISGSVSGRSGINVFEGDEVERADPSAQTAISSGISEQVNLEGVGSGSGLLDLTRESDDTSLGAELLDEIAPGAGGRRSGGERETMMGTGMGGGVVDTRPMRGGMAVQVEAADPMAPAFGAAALAGAAMLIFAMFVVASAVAGTRPEIVETLAQKGWLVIAGIGAGLGIIFFVFGMIIGKMGTR